MAFPTSPTNGQVVVVNNVNYQYANTTNTWTRILTTANVITANTISVNGALSAAGNISTGNYFIGNGSLLTGIATGTPTLIANGTSNVAVASSGGNVSVGIGGTANVAVFATTGEYVTGVISASGNITGSNLLTSGLVSATANITANNGMFTNVVNVASHTGAVVSVSGNVTGGNILTAGLISATSTITGSSLLGTVASLSGNITGGNISTAGLLAASNNLIVNSPSPQAEGGQLILAWANITATGQANSTWNIDVDGTNNLRAFYQNAAGATSVLLSASPSSNILSFPSTAGISVSGNVNAGTNYFIGNGSQLTGISGGGGGSNIANGTSNVTVVSSGGNVTVGVGGTSNVAVFATSGEYITGVISASGNVTGGNILTAGLISSTGTVTGSSFLGSVVSVTANITGGNILTGGLISSTGNAIHSNLILNGTAAAGSGVLIVSGNIQTSTANATANIGNASNYFNRLFAQATTALYADLAEVYQSDAQYPPGTVLVFGGTQEVTISTVSHDARIAGIVSTNPAHVMNSGMTSEFTVEVGLIGRVPCQVIGPIEAGDRVVSSNRAGVAERLDMSKYQPGVIIGKALESYSSTDVGTIEVVVGRL